MDRFPFDLDLRLETATIFLFQENRPDAGGDFVFETPPQKSARL